MVTFHQLIKRRVRIFRKKQCLAKALKLAPQKKGICSRVFILSPKKPCSARRKVVEVFIPSLKKLVIAYIPGISHTLVRFSRVLLRGGSRPDLPGVHYILVRGKYDLQGLILRKKARSKFGVFRHDQPRKRDRRLAIKG